MSKAMTRRLPDAQAPVTPAPDACGWSPTPGFHCIQPEGHGGIGHVVADHPHDPGSTEWWREPGIPANCPGCGDPASTHDGAYCPTPAGP